MPKWLKIILVLVGVVMLLCGLSSAGAYWWFNENKDKLKGVGERAKKEGNAFAYQHDAEECVAEGLRAPDAGRARSMSKHASRLISSKTLRAAATAAAATAAAAATRTESPGVE